MRNNKLAKLIAVVLTVAAIATPVSAESRSFKTGTESKQSGIVSVKDLTVYVGGYKNLRSAVKTKGYPRLEFKSSNQKVLRTYGGYARGMKAGTVTVTVKARSYNGGRETAKFIVNVVKKPQKIKADKYNVFLKGEKDYQYIYLRNVKGDVRVYMEDPGVVKVKVERHRLKIMPVKPGHAKVYVYAKTNKYYKESNLLTIDAKVAEIIVP